MNGFTQRLVVGGAGVIALLLVAAFIIPRRDQFAPSDAPLPVWGKLQPVAVSAGTIPLSDFARFLHDWTGLNIIVDGALSGKVIEVAAPLQNADADTVRALLEENGCTVALDDLDAGTKVLRIRRTNEP